MLPFAACIFSVEGITQFSFLFPPPHFYYLLVKNEPYSEIGLTFALSSLEVISKPLECSA